MRSAKELEAKRVAALRERKAAVAAAVSSKTAELTAAADRAREALTANLKVVVREDEGGGNLDFIQNFRRTRPI